MTLEKYKICPACGEHNPPSLLECRKCEADLTGIKVVDSAAEKTTQEEDMRVQSVAASEALFRICDCGEKNPSQARKCQACGEDISDIIPTVIAEADVKAFSYSLKSYDGSFFTDIDKPVIIVGRESELKEYFANKTYVSRQHAKLTVVAEKVFIENLSNTNKTYVNNKPIDDNSPTVLRDNDEIGLGGVVASGNRQDNAAYFVFGVKS